MLDVNVYHYAMMAKVFLPAIGRSGHRAAFIGVSSASYLRYMPCFLTYTATKAFASQLTLAVEQETAVDLQTLAPFATKTNVVADERMAWFATPVDKAVT